MAKIIVHKAAELDEIEEKLRRSADIAADTLRSIEGDGLSLLSRIKFDRIGSRPTAPRQRLNLIEQVNQTFTCLVTIYAARFLLQKYPEAAPFQLNLGAVSGTDIESKGSSLVAAEVFAAVSPVNNEKLKKDVKRVAATLARHKYVFFMAPGYGRKLEKVSDEAGVEVWAMSYDE